VDDDESAWKSNSDNQVDGGLGGVSFLDTIAQDSVAPMQCESISQLPYLNGKTIGF
jgi:hypothetical protein